jgi:chemotaxis protein methyltransferase CheR
VLPPSRPAGAPLRVLSAGCASGEEAYTVGMFARERGVGARLRITGIDVNPAVVARARRGRYSAWSLRATPHEARERWFERDGAEFILSAEIRRMAAFEERNLLDEDPAFWAPHAFDVIFCRNVLIYFSREAMQATIARFARALAPGGLLFLGDAENLRGISHDFHLQHTHDTFYYSVREALAAAPRPVAARATPAVADAFPAVALPADESWVDAIHEAADRIARLARTNHAPAAAPATPRAAPPAPPAPTAAADGIVAATLLLRQERYAEAMTVLDGLGPDTHDDPDVQLLRAGLCVNQGDLDEARRTCGRLLELDELNAGAHYLLALCDEHAGDLASAAEHDRVAAYLDATFAMPRLHLGRLARRRGDLETARAELSRALDLLAREETTRVLLFGGGFGRDVLSQLARAELRACGEAP